MHADPTAPIPATTFPALHAGHCYASSCGRVTLYLGDSLEIAPTLQGVDAIISDPPYGMDWNTDHTRFVNGPNGTGGKGERTQARNMPKIHGDEKPFDPAPWLTWEKVVLFGSNHFASRLPVGTTLVWLKKYDSAFGTFLSDAEVAWMKGGHGVYAMRDTELLGEASKSRVHPTQKPVPIMGWCMDQAKVPEGALVLDPYMGSGTTGIACIRTGRRFVGIERDPVHYATALERIKNELAQGDLFHSQHNH
jgi:site-specific DNA-methyltransferase (adenine-specific)